MIIKKVLNNNVIVTEDNQQHEVIVMGLGIGFQKKVGMEIDEAKIDKVFKIQEEETKNAIDILESVPVEFLELTTKIVSYAKTLVGKPMDDIIFVSLADHIHSSLVRYEEGVILRNALLW
ncbi:MAG TPA: CAT RNA binding domain-containing protein, partial [Erysipelothrix sp.]|nr:CAT RNA binding domain-containing protein [Erysipelothrix sp.]